jgi:DNA-binding NtrC family response regulator
MTKKILVVDDQPLVVELVNRVLTRAGYDVQVAHGADEAEAMSRQTKHDLLITDCYMPGRDGLELSRRCKEEDPQLMTILMGGVAGSELAVDFGLADAVLKKPFTTSELLEVVQRLLSVSH